MDSEQKYTKVRETELSGFIYTFESDFVLELMRLELTTSICLVLQIERYVEENYMYTYDKEFELAGVVKTDDPFYYIIELEHHEHLMFCRLHKTDSDTYLDYYNKNMVITKEE